MNTHSWFVVRPSCLHQIDRLTQESEDGLMTNCSGPTRNKKQVKDRAPTRELCLGGVEDIRRSYFP